MGFAEAKATSKCSLSPDGLSPTEFLDTYVDLIRTSHDPGQIGAWLLKNARSMNESMFYDSKLAWSRLERLGVGCILSLRGCAPSGVFTATAKGAYLAQIAQDSELRQIADALFSDDYEFITSLPPEYGALQTQLIQLMQMAYRSGIRAADRRVKNM